MQAPTKRERYLQIFQYLREFSKLRSNPVRDIRNSEAVYPEKIWLVDIPQYDGVDSILFPNYSTDTEYWLKVIKPAVEPVEPQFSKPPVEIQNWIDPKTLSRSPKLLQNSLGDHSENLADHPEIQVAFDIYLRKTWPIAQRKYTEELAEFEDKKRVFDERLDLYKKLFSLYNKLQQNSEEYELLFAVGLLNFKKDQLSPTIFRHLFTVKAEIYFEYDPRKSQVIVQPVSDATIQVETESVIDLDPPFSISQMVDGESRVKDFLTVKDLANNLFDTSIKEASQMFVEVALEGKFFDDLHYPKTTQEAPAIYFAPALILRKRNTKSFTALYEALIKEIENASEDFEVETLDDLISDKPQGARFHQSEDSASDGSEFESIFFPKKYNEEQIQIVQKARKSNKVLVQGPPGTGKSHTIANLISHLLAHGKKILVTAATKRALEVLKKQLPDSFQELCVNLLSDDARSIKELEASVSAINDHLSDFSDLDEEKEGIDRLSAELWTLRETISSVTRQIIDIKQQDIGQLKLNEQYSGTLTELAEILEGRQAQHIWYDDPLVDISQIHLLDRLADFARMHNSYSRENVDFLEISLPQKERLIDFNPYNEYLESKALFESAYATRTSQFDQFHFQDIELIRKLLASLRMVIQDIQNVNSPFADIVIDERFYKGVDWEEMVSKTKRLTSDHQLETVRERELRLVISYPKDKSWAILKGDAQVLHDYLKGGKSLSGFGFKARQVFLPKEIREKLYFIDAVKVNDSACDTLSEFEAVIEDIRLKQSLDALDRLWSIQISVSKSSTEALEYYKKLGNDVNKLITLKLRAHELLLEIKKNSGASLSISTDSVSFLEQAVEYFEEKQRLLKVREGFDKSLAYLQQFDSHPTLKELIDSIASEDTARIRLKLAELSSLYDAKEDYKRYKELQRELLVFFPGLVGEIVTEGRLSRTKSEIVEAIYFHHAKTEFKQAIVSLNESSLIDQLNSLEQREHELVAALASKKAWYFVIKSLEENRHLKRDLIAWVLAIKRIGRGTGKKAARFRRSAQEQMERCKNSVPCWIMPLYKVAETIKPQKGIYDYVIIDEASQLGPDALFLLFIAKKIIIVGDDKQTSPEYVGVDANVMYPHIQRYLQGIPFKDYYGTDFSFFDHATMFCDGITVLREHFRCMPEIIEFCNQNFYLPEGKGLFALKQYSEKRLKPLETVFCNTGYIEGSASNIINRPEAEAIVDKIAALVKDDNYRGKTMGVIVLQGTSQAALIEKKLIERLGEVEYSVRKLVCGNSASFQGDERDIMFLSLITATNHNRMPLAKPEDERRFNVAVSRAKEQIWLFHSVRLNDLVNQTDLRYKLLNYFLNTKPKAIGDSPVVSRKLGNHPEPFGSWFEVDVYNDIVNKGYRVQPQYEVVKGRYRIDLVTALGDGTKIAIECDGDKFHTAETFENDMMRQRVLERCGWQFFRVRGCEYYANRRKSLEPLWDILGEPNYFDIKDPLTDIVDSDSVIHETLEIVDEEYVVNHLPGQYDVVDSDEQSDYNDNNGTLFSNSFSEYDSMPSIDITLQTNHKSIQFIAAELTSESVPQTDLLVFTTKAHAHLVRSNGSHTVSTIIGELELESDEEIIFVLEAKDYSGYLLCFYKNGKGAKITLSSYKIEQNRRMIKSALHLDSELVHITHVQEDADFVALSSFNKVVVFNSSLINPVTSRVSKGVQVIKLKEGSHLSIVKPLIAASLQDSEYYRKDSALNAVGYFLKKGDVV